MKPDPIPFLLFASGVSSLFLCEDRPGGIAMFLQTELAELMMTCSNQGYHWGPAAGAIPSSSHRLHLSLALALEAQHAVVLCRSIDTFHNC